MSNIYDNNTQWQGVNKMFLGVLGSVLLQTLAGGLLEKGLKGRAAIAGVTGLALGIWAVCQPEKKLDTGEVQKAVLHMFDL